VSWVASIKFSARWIGKTGDLRQVLRALLSVALRRVQASADRGRAHVDLAEDVLDPLERKDLTFECGRESFELLAERHGDGVLELRAAHLQHRGELFPLLAERRDELLHRGDELDVAERHADVQRRRVGVVCRLRAIDVVVRVAVFVLPLLVPHELQRPVGDHLVRVHIGRGARAALDDVEAKLLVELSVDELLAGPLDPFQDLFRELLAVIVRARGGELHHRRRP
jgi:hypothetical protein